MKTTFRALPVKTGVDGRVAFDIQDNLPMVREFYRGIREREAKSGKTYEVEVTVDVHYRQRSLKQLNLLWALVEIMALEEQGSYDEDTKYGYYEGLLDLYAPRIDARLTDRNVPKRASDMTTVELSKVIEGAFQQLAWWNGISFESAAQLRNYWIEWHQWRGKAKRDPLDGTYESLEDYRQRIAMCEACTRRLESGAGHMAHIVSRGAGGGDTDPSNFLLLCPECHLYTQHQHGWQRLLRDYPHLKHKVDRARESQSARPVSETRGPTGEAPEDTEVGMF